MDRPAELLVAPAGRLLAERAAELVAELDRMVPEMEPASLLALRAEIARIGEAMTGRALGIALAGNGREEKPSRDLTGKEAAARLQRSESWLYHNWRRLRLGFVDEGRLRFRSADLDRYLTNCRRRSR